MLRKLTKYDVFAKPTPDAIVKTTSGGILAIISLALIGYLCFCEFISYRTPVMRSRMIIDRERGNRLEINVNITFPNLPCSLLSLDIIDSSGEVQQGVDHSMNKISLDNNGNELSKEVLDIGKTTELKNQSSSLQNYCGSCYGAEDDEYPCCNTCADVREAYSKKGWAFTDGDGVEQCERIGFKESLKQQYNQGCNIAGSFRVQKVVGNFHFSPGMPLHIDDRHSHDLSHYQDPMAPFTFTHFIHELSFGPKVQHLGHDHAFQNPLENTSQITDSKWFHFSYFIKVVSTRFEFISGEIIETNQYAATAHKRPLQGGRDEDHKNTRHMRGGLPGVFFSYDISPLRIINQQEYKTHLGMFLTQIVATIGGILTVAAILDRGIYEMDQALKRKKNR